MTVLGQCRESLLLITDWGDRRCFPWSADGLMSSSRLVCTFGWKRTSTARAPQCSSSVRSWSSTTDGVCWTGALWPLWNTASVGMHDGNRNQAYEFTVVSFPMMNRHRDAPVSLISSASPILQHQPIQTLSFVQLQQKFVVFLFTTSES